METPKPITGPYRATRLWNEAIRLFNNGVPRKRHWRQLRQYENCFTASEAVSWLHSQLIINPHFGPTVTKDQTQQLLCKFLKAGVFEDVRGTETKVEHFKDNSGLYRLTNRSPFRNPRTPGRRDNPRTPLGTVPNRGNHNEESGSPVLARAKASLQSKAAAVASSKPRTGGGDVDSGKPMIPQLTQCQLTSRQLKREEVEDLWKSTTLRQIANVLGFPNCKDILDPTHVKGKWILWNVTHIGSRGIVQPMGDDCPPSWVLYGMKSLVNWPSNDHHKLPEYSGSEKDVFKVICDYFTSSSGPLTLFSMYNAFVEAFIRAEAHDVQVSQAKERGDDDDDCSSLSSRDSVHSLVMKMASPMPCHLRKASSYSTRPQGAESHSRYEYVSYPIVKSPVKGLNRPRLASRMSQDYSTASCIQPLVNKVKSASVLLSREAVKPSETRITASAAQLPHNACYETAFTSVEPETRIIPQDEVEFLRRSSSSSRRRSEMIPQQQEPKTNLHPVHSFRVPGVDFAGSMDPRRRGFPGGEKENVIYRSLDRLRSKSGGYVNVAAFGSVECLDRADRTENCSQVWGYPEDYSNASSWMNETPSTTLHQQHSRSISSLSSFRTSRTGLSPSSFSDSAQGAHDYENLREFSRMLQMSTMSSSSSCTAGPDKSPVNLRTNSSHLYHCSPSKRLVGRRIGLEFYYGAKACRPGLVTEEGKAMAIESLQLLTLVLPPGQRRKLHLLLRFMAKVAANTQLVLDPDVPLKTLMINTFYRCIICSPNEADYDELLAVRLVTFLMENAEAIMVVPHQLCTRVRDRLVELQREKIRFDPDDAVPLAYCQQVSPKRYEQQSKDESGQAVRQLLEHIIDDKNMSLKDKRKRLKQFRSAYPDIYYSRFPTPELEARVTELEVRPRKQPMFARIRSLRL